MTGTAIAVGTSRLPAAAELPRSTNLARVVDELRDLLRPLSSNVFEMGDTYDEAEKLLLARHLVASPLSSAVLEYPAALRRLADAPPDEIAIARLIAKTVDSRPGYRPPDVKSYMASVVASVSRRGFGLAVVQLACTEIREADPAEFHHALPSEHHFIQACEEAKRSLENEASRIERIVNGQNVARGIVARAAQIEAVEGRRNANAPAPAAVQRALGEAAERLRGPRDR